MARPATKVDLPDPPFIVATVITVARLRAFKDESCLSLSAKDYDKIKLFEKTLENLDLVSNFIVLSFNNKDIFYKIIYNGSPDKFFNEIKDVGLNFEKNNQIWKSQ